MSVFVPIRKNDQHRDGHTSVLAKSGKITCPVSITERLVGLLPSTADSRLCPVVRRIVKIKKQERFHDRLGISYSTALENMRKFLSHLVDKVSDFATHSIKSGGTSNFGFKKADPELKDGWKNPSTKQRYMKRSAEELITVTKAMNI